MNKFLTAQKHWLHRRNPTVDVHSTATAKMSTELWQRKQAQLCDSSGSDSAEIMMCTLVWQRWQLTVLQQRCQLPLHVLSQWCEHRSHTNVKIHFTALSVDTSVTLVCTVMSQCCHCHHCCTVASLHCTSLTYYRIYSCTSRIFWTWKWAQKIDLDLYSGEHETYLPNHKKNAKIHCNKPSYGVK